jgi:thiol-disulfide isomerase/thioredoxin
MNKRILLPCIFLFLCCIIIQHSAVAQNKTGVYFTDSSWQTLLVKAKNEHKLIFMDAFTTWCGPCKWMDKNVFPDENVAAVYNRNFINAHTDMEKGEGIDLRKKYEVKAYPTFLFINGDGEIVHKAVGQSSVSEFIQFGLDAISPARNLQYFQKNYAANKANYNFISDYCNALKVAYENDAASEIALDFLEKQKPQSLIESSNWQLFNQNVSDASSSVFQYVVDHQKQFQEQFEKKIVDEKIYMTYLAWPQHYLRYDTAGAVIFNGKGFDDFIFQVQKSSYEKKNEVIAKAKLTVFFGQKKWKSYTETIAAMIKDQILPLDKKGAEQIYFYADMVYRFAKNDQKALKAAAGFAKTISMEVPGIGDRNKAEYLELYANLLEETNQKDLSVSVRNMIDHKKLEEAQSGNSFQMLKPAGKK